MTTTKESALRVSGPSRARVRASNYSAAILHDKRRRVNIRLTERFWNIMLLVILFIGLPLIYMLLQQLLGVA